MARKTAALRPIMTRIPEGLRRRLEREAELNGHSMNREIIDRLEQSFRRHDTEAVIQQAMDRIADRFGSLLARGFEPVEIPEMTDEQKARHDAQVEASRGSGVENWDDSDEPVPPLPDKDEKP